jgi:phenylpropionate dioxygenase-like ring-hydroxylating dioxygenase large terminal subunit
MSKTAPRPAIENGASAAGSSPVHPQGRFLRNIWYMGLWSTDLGPEAMIDRIIVGEPILFVRDDDGRAAAIRDICSHRFAPLHLGKRCAGGQVRCLYHGMSFNTSGACVDNPFGDRRIAHNAALRSYPVVEKHGIVWIWMGTKTPDPSLIPDYSVIDRAAPGTLTKFDYLHFTVNYELIVDNLLDLSHTAFLHEGILGNPKQTRAKLEVLEDTRSVTVKRTIIDIPVYKLFDLLFRQDGRNIDSWDAQKWMAPGCILGELRVKAPGDPDERGTGLNVIHILTPETATTTHYSFSAVRLGVENGTPASPEVSAKIAEMRRDVFIHQDAMMINAQQTTMQRFPQFTQQPALTSIDAGPSRFKQVLRRLLEADPESGPIVTTV